MPEKSTRKEPEFRVGTHLHPGHFAGEWAEGLDSDAVFTTLKNAQAKAAETAHKLLETRQAVLSNSMKTEAANLEEFAKAHTKAAERTTQAMDQAISYAEQTIREIEKTLAAPVASPSNQGTASDIRQHFKTLGHDDRAALLEEAFASGDEETLTAILSGPAYLTGLSKAQHAQAKRRYQQSKYPDEFRRLDKLRKARDIVVNAGQQFVSLSGEIHAHDSGKLKAGKEAEARARAALSHLEPPA
ncbi:hypothetical protein [Halomonas sp.]|uniref:hypothetical protein n=1 Tax=Halomonas sp. TaxID=1486246 RepID=UPI00262F5DB1|nr:hypothetical protein [Halomonas sp.]